MCQFPIEDGESGIITGYVGAQGETGTAPQHIECFLRSILGSVAHLRGTCSCFGGTDVETRENYRQQARETMAWLTQHGMRKV